LCFYATIVCPEDFHIFQNYTTSQNQKSKGWTSRDFVLDCVQKMTEQEEREVEEESADIQLVSSTLRALTTSPSK
jgi:hypothetical protein